MAQAEIRGKPDWMNPEDRERLAALTERLLWRQVFFRLAEEFERDCMTVNVHQIVHRLREIGHGMADRALKEDGQ